MYRVLPCQEDELTTVVSALSDGWKFEQVCLPQEEVQVKSYLLQLLPSSSAAASYTYSGNEALSEYLCIVSKEYPESTSNEKSSDRVNALLTKARQM